MSDTSVWIRKRKLASGKTSYHLRWVCPTQHRWVSRLVGTDRKRAEREASKLEGELSEGTYTATRRISWEAFVEDHVTKLDGKLHAIEAERILTEFGRVTRVSGPMQVTYPLAERWVAWMQAKGLRPATINKNLGYLTTAMNRAVKRGFAGRNPVDTDLKKIVEMKDIRVLTTDEEPRLLASTKDLYGTQMETFVRFTLETWGRLSEVTGLLWVDVQFDDRCVYFRSTKSHEDRFIPLDPSTGMLDDLRRLQAMTLESGGPFMVYQGERSNLRKKWLRIIADAEIIPHITIHDLRRTGITRALLANMPPVAVMKMAGHKDLSTTMKYYTKVGQRDLREAVEKMNKRNAG